MKRWQIVYGLPLEVWVDIFSYPWITRAEFGQLVHLIGNFKFAEHAQFFLHEWGKRTLDMENVFFDKRGFCKWTSQKPYRLCLDVPRTPLPTNIRQHLGTIIIEHFDANTMDFLGRIRPLLSDLDIRFCPSPKLWSSRIILSRFAPLLDGNRIHSLYCYEFALPAVKLCLGDKLAELKVLTLSYYGRAGVPQENVNIIMEWLNPVGPVDGTRFCAINHRDEFFEQIHTAVRQQFLAAPTPPSTFVLNLKHCYQKWQFAEFHLENRAGEELHGKWIEVVGDPNRRIFQITRHGPSWSTGELQEWAKEVTAADNEGRRCRIRFSEPTIGSLAAVPVDVPPADAAQQAVQPQQPCSSKDTEIVAIREVIFAQFCINLTKCVFLRFLSAKTPCTFAMNLMIPSGNVAADEFHLANGIGEVLHGEWAEDVGIFQITRHPVDRNTEQVRAECLRIGFGQPTVGSLAVAQVDIPPVDEEQNIQQQPSCSKTFEYSIGFGEYRFN